MCRLSRLSRLCRCSRIFDSRPGQWAINDSSDPVCKREKPPQGLSLWKGLWDWERNRAVRVMLNLIAAGIWHIYDSDSLIAEAAIPSDSVRNATGEAWLATSVPFLSAVLCLDDFAIFFCNFYPVANVWYELMLGGGACLVPCSDTFTLTHKGLRLLRYDVYLSSWSRITASKVEWFYSGELLYYLSSWHLQHNMT